MIIDYAHSKVKYTTKGKINGNIKQWNSIYTLRCSKCKKEFTERCDIIDERKKQINIYACGKCAKPLQRSRSALIGVYDKDGNLKPNKGRYTTDRVKAMTDEEYKIFVEQRRKASQGFHDSLEKDPVKYKKHYKKIYKNSKIGYISKGQREIHKLLEPFGFELEKNVHGLNVDIVHLDRKIIIEYFGDYFHANPRKYKKDEYINIIGMTAQEKWAKDRRRNFKLRKLGFQVIIIWENKWVNEKKKVLTQLNNLSDLNYKLEEWWKLETSKARQMKNVKFDRNKYVPYEEVDQFLSEGWEFGFISR